MNKIYVFLAAVLVLVFAAGCANKTIDSSSKVNSDTSELDAEITAVDSITQGVDDSGLDNLDTELDAIDNLNI